MNAKGDIEKAGDMLQIVLLVYAVGFSGVNSDIDGAKQLALSFASAQVTTEILKRAIKEKRPNYESGNKKDSFPSGHTMAAFLGATYMHKRYGIDHAIVPYIAVTFVGYSRIHSKKHYTHDVLAGAGIAALYT